MVHQTRSPGMGTYATRRHHTGMGQRSAPQAGRYVLIPDRLIRDMAHDPLAVGVYVGVARLASAARAAVPLAARDLALWMGRDRDADRVAVMRRIGKLAEAGWLVITRTVASKHALLPTWGPLEAGVVRPWQFDRPDTGRPEQVRGRRVPIGLLDDYMGRLDPQPGHRHALISRYFTRPLLDLTDIGVYTIGLRAEITPTPRLQQLGLHTQTGVCPPLPGNTLLRRVQAGQVSAHDDGKESLVGLSLHGCMRLGIVSPLSSDSGSGSVSGSASGSVTGSSDQPEDASVSGLSDVANTDPPGDTPQIAWDDPEIHESLNQPANHAHARDQTVGDGGSPDRAVHDQVAPDVIQGHVALNTTRPIFPGEWRELLALQHQHGVDQLLIWQARASRADCPRPRGITPEYYQVCSTNTRAPSVPTQPSGNNSLPARPSGNNSLPTRPSENDPLRETLLRQMGIRARQPLSDVPTDMIAAWAQVITHPGITTRFLSPAGYAVAQMRHGLLPPTPVELAHWEQQTRRSTDRYESWRHIQPTPAQADKAQAEKALEARVRAIVPPGASVAVVCTLANLLAKGVPEAEALAQVGGQSPGGSVCASI